MSRQLLIIIALIAVGCDAYKIRQRQGRQADDDARLIVERCVGRCPDGPTRIRFEGPSIENADARTKCDFFLRQHLDEKRYDRELFRQTFKAKAFGDLIGIALCCSKEFFDTGINTYDCANELSRVGIADGGRQQVQDVADDIVEEEVAADTAASDTQSDFGFAQPPPPPPPPCATIAGVGPVRVQRTEIEISEEGTWQRAIATHLLAIFIGAGILLLILANWGYLRGVHGGRTVGHATGGATRG